ncbi:MAG TPA: DNA mismatch repair endonuclease MutL [candidate division Zixibacteria bacterium]|nr:DNA mismatch repair endonuclease MutL [candidate division Zixibacteria bacterium]
MSNPTTIVKLDQKTINKIAAGEVVERPASVVKELIENSIDALANEITIVIEGYGLDLIKIIDNGTGMSKDDAALAWKSHTTSKLKKIEDLDLINSLGFRGEALASIASVSMMEILTRKKETLTGTIVRIKGGNLELIEERECAPGTTISIRNLFYNVPARRKFLKTPTTELGHIIEIVNRQALIHPEIHFKLFHNNSLLLNSPKSTNTLEPIISVFGIELAKQMIEVLFKSESITITGFTSIPSLSRSTRDYEMFYVNKRFIKSTLLSEALEEAYKTLLMKNRFPVVLLNIELEGSQIDVNIHPTKREVRFGDTKNIFEKVKEAITLALNKSDLWRKSKGLMKSEDELLSQSILKINDEDGFVSTEHDNNLLVNTIDKKESDQKTSFSLDTKLSIDFDESSKSSLQLEESAIELSPNFWIRPLGQAHNLFILCETSEGIAIVDIHAAHERIKYEQLLAQFTKSKFEVQELLHPLTFELTKEQIAFLKTNLEQLWSVGIELEHFGGNTYLVRKLPVIMGLVKTENDIKNFLDELKKDIANIKDINERIDLILKTMACHSVVRAGEAITLTKTAQILRNLSNCNYPFTCPHGRPTIILIPKRDLEKEFGRII